MVAQFLVLLLSIESFGAVVSDNDGSAFITRAEFYSLKNDFQSQLDAYNATIDSKIDNAIAGYLAGLKTEKKSSGYHTRTGSLSYGGRIFLYYVFCSPASTKAFYITIFNKFV